MLFKKRKVEWKTEEKKKMKREREGERKGAERGREKRRKMEEGGGGREFIREGRDREKD